MDLQNLGPYFGPNFGGPKHSLTRLSPGPALERLVEEAQQSTTANGRRTDINGGQTASFGKPGTHESATTPKNILFIQNLPHETSSMMLQVLFQQYPGFREVRMIEAKPGIAFVEFEDDVRSSVAMQALQGFKITPQNPMAVTYAKK
ncbi:hypothetical protein ACSBR1_002208 [Camellia fascicularis]